MRKALSIGSSIVFGMLFASSMGFAAGFRLPDQDSTAMSMGGAFVGQADNPAAVWYNPAGITQLDGTRASAGVIAISPVLKHENTDGSTDVSKRMVHLPFHLYGTSRINDRVTLGVGLNSPFGLSTEWAATSSTRYVATLSKLETISVNPNIAYAISDSLSVAAGVSYIKLDATLEKLLPFPGDPAFKLRGTGDGWGVNAGALLKATEKLNIGLSYRPRVKVKVDDATADVPALGISNPAETTIMLPDLMQLGISYKASDRLTLNTDLEYTGWSSFDRLVVTSNTILALSGGATNTQIDEKEWKNTWTFRIGGQYKISEQWKVRAGYVYDQNPVPDDRVETSLPDSDRHGITVGCGYTIGKVTIDASYMYLKFVDRTVTNSMGSGTAPDASLNGKYKSEAHLAGITIGYQF